MPDRWEAFSPLELIVINEALNCAFEGTPKGSRWDDEAQKIAGTIPAVDSRAAEPIIVDLNGDVSGS